ncbi:MAG: hypothetical protein LBS92_00925 [Candidatus Methanoplasma sp.]|nr:hypothetical protein [Candidatus Methanoplasma sp.]
MEAPAVYSTTKNDVVLVHVCKKGVNDNEDKEYIKKALKGIWPETPYLDEPFYEVRCSYCRNRYVNDRD